MKEKHMRYIKIEDAKPGMCLAYNMYDADGHTLICNGSVLSEFYIKRLNDYGFDGVYIEDELSKDIQIDPIITPELRAEGLITVRESNIDGCKSVAKQIVEQVLDRGVLSLDLTDLRSFDGYTYAHSVNVAVIACIIGLGLNMEDKDLEQLAMAGLLHDLGKLVIPREILNKTARLTSEEYDIMKTHASLSYEIIRERWDIPANVKTAVLYHHENVDGSGYPEGMDGEQTSLFTKILHTADVYDALVSKRPYKEPYSPYEACEYLMGGGGIMFEPKIVEALMLCVPFYPKGTEVKLSDGRNAIIVENAGAHNLRPLLRMFDGTTIDLQTQDNFNITILHGINETVLDPVTGEADRKKMLMPVRRYRIMVIDSMRIHIQTLQGILHHMYDLEFFTSAEQAFMHLKRHTEPDLVIIELNMPRVNGFEAAEKLRGIMGDTVPILFEIDTNDKSVIARCRKAGAAGYIVRPYKPTFVKAEIRRILTGQSVAE